MLSPDPAVLNWQLCLQQSHRLQRSVTAVPTLVSWCLQLSLPALLLSAAKQILKLRRQHGMLSCKVQNLLFYFSLQLSGCYSKHNFYDLEPTLGISCKLFFKDSEMPCMRRGAEKNYLIFSVS